MAEYTFQTTDIDEEILLELNVNFEASVREMMVKLRDEALRRRMMKRYTALMELPQHMRKAAEESIDVAIKAVDPAFRIDPNAKE